jgi:prepilin-type N-terminal cleavage/methylation domain-containing protein
MRAHALRRTAYTLIELLVVLVILGLASAIVLPALLRTRSSERPLQTVIDNARDAAAQRGEVIYLRVEPTGAWHMEGGGSPLESDSAGGRIAPLAAVPLTLLISPSGSCAFDVRSAAAASALLVDPLTCTVRLPAAKASSS